MLEPCGLIYPYVLFPVALLQTSKLNFTVYYVMHNQCLLYTKCNILRLCQWNVLYMFTFLFKNRIYQKTGHSLATMPVLEK